MGKLKLRFEYIARTYIDKLGSLSLQHIMFIFDGRRQSHEEANTLECFRDAKVAKVLDIDIEIPPSYSSDRILVFLNKNQDDTYQFEITVQYVSVRCSYEDRESCKTDFLTKDEAITTLGTMLRKGLYFSS